MEILYSVRYCIDKIEGTQPFTQPRAYVVEDIVDNYIRHWELDSYATYDDIEIIKSRLMGVVGAEDIIFFLTELNEACEGYSSYEREYLDTYEEDEE